MSKLSLEDRAQLIAAPGTHTLQCAREHLHAVAAEARAGHCHCRIEGETLIHSCQLHNEQTREAEQRGREQALEWAAKVAEQPAGYYQLRSSKIPYWDGDKAAALIRRGPDAEKGGEDA